MPAPDWIITKRLLGILFVLGGGVGLGGVLLLDRLRGGAGDFGPTQQLAVIGCGAVILVGLSLIPFGNRPA
ncbi:MAG TPA: hypothetical protein PLD47_15495 [Aggregatilineales bacterium]|nr:hypothetical protein [Anaerolineales bacterium]HRE49132.1 hypothetical protein [Aggregatilineales bacterium]